MVPLGVGVGGDGREGKGAENAVRVEKKERGKKRDIHRSNNRIYFTG